VQNIWIKQSLEKHKSLGYGLAYF